MCSPLVRHCRAELFRAASLWLYHFSDTSGRFSVRITAGDEAYAFMFREHLAGGGASRPLEPPPMTTEQPKVSSAEDVPKFSPLALRVRALVADGKWHTAAEIAQQLGETFNDVFRGRLLEMAEAEAIRSSPGKGYHRVQD